MNEPSGEWFEWSEMDLRERAEIIDYARQLRMPWREIARRLHTTVPTAKATADLWYERFEQHGRSDRNQRKRDLSSLAQAPILMGVLKGLAQS